MINLKKFTLNLTEPQYRQLENFSYSKISSFEKEGPQGLFKSDFVETSSTAFGKLVDTLITAPEEFNNKYFVMKDPPTNDKILSACKYLSKTPVKHLHTLEDLTEEQILKVLELVKFYPNYKDKTKLSNFKDAASDYFSKLIAAKGKSIISEEDLQLALLISNQFETNIYLKNIFKPNSLFEKDEVEIFFQPMFQIKDENLKAMMDFVVVNHTQKTITIIDLKMFDDIPEKFLRSFFNFKYYRQAEVYTYIIKHLLESQNSDYTLNPFKFIVVSKTNFKILQYDFEILYNKDGLLYVNNNLYPSFKQLIEEINWHNENDERVYTREQVNNQGVVTIPNCTPELKQLLEHDNLY